MQGGMPLRTKSAICATPPLFRNFFVAHLHNRPLGESPFFGMKKGFRNHPEALLAENTRFELHSTGFSINREKRRHAGENSVITTVPGVVRKRMLRSFPAGTYPTEGTRREPRYAVVDNGGSRRTDGRPEFHERWRAMSGTSGSRRSWCKLRGKTVRGGTS